MTKCHVFQNNNGWSKKFMDYEAEGANPRGGHKNMEGGTLGTEV